MGIAGFQKWLVATFPDAVTKVKPVRRGGGGGRGGRGGGRGGGRAPPPPDDPASVDSFDHVCVDFAQLIHTNARKSADPTMLVTLIFQEVDRLLRTLSDRRYEHVTAIVSGPHVAGEGELKIIDYLHTSVAPTDSVVIVGSDADIILQGVLTTCVRDFFVYIGGAPREPATLLSVWMLVRQLDELFPGESAAVRADFVVLCLLNGNDYLPKL
eukprot:contig_41063_g9377